MSIDPGVTVPDAVITHIFSFSGLSTPDHAREAHEVIELGRYAKQVKDRPDRDVMIVDTGHHELAIKTHDVDLGKIDLEASIWFDGSGLLQLHLVQKVSAAPAEIAQALQVFCHDRDTLTIDGQPLASWVSQAAGSADPVTLRQDVLQIVDYPRALQDVLREGTEPSGAALSIVYRNPQATSAALGSVRVPAELNRDPRNVGMHGRGVLLISGHSPGRQAALRLTACELLFAVGRARRARASIETHLREAAGVTFVDGRWQDVSFLQKLSVDVRRQRIVLALDVRAYADGLFMPELVIDNFRSSFGEALRLEVLTSSSLDLVDTLSEVVQSFLEEAKLLASNAGALRQRRWQLVVGIASGIAIPVALLLSYFGVSSQVNVPSGTSIFDLDTYALPWLIAVATTTLVIALSYRQHRINEP